MTQVAMLWLVNEERELLLAQRALIKDNPGLWGPSVTGKVEEGETFIDAAVREAQEELAYKPESKDLRLLLEADYLLHSGEVRQIKAYAAFAGRALIDDLTLNPNEVAAVRWASVVDIRELLKTQPPQLVAAFATELWNDTFTALT